MTTTQLSELKDVINYASSSAAQVWAALIVFLILLVRDKRAANIEEENLLWEQARENWDSILAKLNDVNPGGLRSKLSDFDLDFETICRAKSDRTAFRKIMKAIKLHKIISTYTISHPLLGGHQYYEGVMIPIAERVEELGKLKMREELPFQFGIFAIAVNMGLLLSMGIWFYDIWPKIVLGLLIICNLLIGFFFVLFTYTAFDVNNLDKIIIWQNQVIKVLKVIRILKMPPFN